MRSFIRNFCTVAVALIMVVVLGRSAMAQTDPNFFMHMDSSDVFGGSMFTATAKLDVLQPAEIQGWSFSLCSDPAELTPLSTALGAGTSTVKNGSPPDFENTNISADAVMNGVVICFTGCASLGQVIDFELLDVSYQVEASVGHTSSVDFCTAGSPGVSTLVVINGDSVIPEWLGASFTALSPNFLKFGNGMGIAAQSAHLPVLVSTVRPLDGLSIAGFYDSTLLSLIGVSASGVAANADFVETSSNVASGEIAAGLIMAFDTSIDIPIGEDQEVMTVDFQIIGDLRGRLLRLSPMSFSCRVLELLLSRT